MTVPVRATSICRRAAMPLAALMTTLAVAGCATSQKELMPVGDTTMRDIWQHQAGHSTGERRLLDVRSELRRPLGGGVTVALNNAGLAGFENVDQAFPIFITDYLPTGIGIVVILAVMSAILSTTDTRLHSTGVTTARDIYDWYADDASDQQLMKVSRIATTFWGVTATAMAVNPPGTIITLYTFRAILLTSAFLIPIYLGLYWTGVAGNAIIASIVVGTLLGVGWDLSGGFLGVPATFMGVGGAFVALLIGHLVWSDSGGGRTSVAAGD